MTAALRDGLGGQGDPGIIGKSGPGRGGQGLASAGGDALAQGDNLGQRLLAPPANSGTVERVAAMGPSFVQALEGEQAFGEALFEGGEGFGGGG